MKNLILVAMLLTVIGNAYAENCGATLGDSDRVEEKQIKEDGLKDASSSEASVEQAG
jgi:hypothetical protein